MRGLALLAVSTMAGIGLAWALWTQTPAQGAAPRGQQAPASRSLAQARGEAARARDRATQLDREARAATQASERAIIAAAALAARVQQAEAALATADAELATVRGQRVALDRRLASERAPAVRLLAGLQTQVRRPVLLTLLQPGSIEDAVRLRAVAAGIGPQIEARTASIRGALARARALERTASGLAVDRRALQAELFARRGELAALSAAERLKARRAGEAADREAERAFAIGERARDLGALVRGLDAGPVFSRSPTEAPLSGPAPYRLPASGPTAPVEAGAASGLTVVARPGSVVVAPGAGRVAFAGPYRGYGTIVIIEHASGWTSLVTGLARADVAVGQTLVAGSLLGQAPARLGRIGLELRRNGQRVNPLDQLR